MASLLSNYEIFAKRLAKGKSFLVAEEGSLMGEGVEYLADNKEEGIAVEIREQIVWDVQLSLPDFLPSLWYQLNPRIQAGFRLVMISISSSEKPASNTPAMNKRNISWGGGLLACPPSVANIQCSGPMARMVLAKSETGGALGVIFVVKAK
jgi:hypothetical protein